MDEQALVSAARRGDVQAFNTLILNHQTLVYNVAFRVLHDEDGASDATQEAFISAFRALHSFRGGSFKAWILRIVVNACYDQLRKTKRRPASSLDEMLVDPDHSDILDDHSETPEEYVMRRDLSDAIQAGLDSLPPDQRAVIVLSDVQELSYEEISRATGVSLGTVKSRLSRGRARLRDYLLRTRELEPMRHRLSSG
jgi:RNA polymerase sigma-70 factor (ECF subfamily)